MPRSIRESTAAPKEISVARGERVSLPDGSRLELESFSHKRPLVGGPTKATAHFKLTRPGESSELRFDLSVTGTEGKPEKTFERRFVGDLEIGLTDFQYDASVRIGVRHVPTIAARYDVPITLRAGQIARLPDGFKLGVAGIVEVVHPETGARVKRLDLDSYVDDHEPFRATLYENGTPALVGRWTGEPGLRVDGRVIRIVTLARDDVALVIGRAAPRSARLRTDMRALPRRLARPPPGR